LIFIQEIIHYNYNTPLRTPHASRTLYWTSFHPLGFSFIQEIIHHSTPLNATRTLHWIHFSSIRV
jgi:hypothetical protein